MNNVFYKEKEFARSLKCEYPKSWRCDRFDSFITLEYGKGLTESTRREGQYPVFGSNGIVGYHDEKLVKGPGIVVGRKGTIGAVSLSKKDFWPIDTTFYVRIKADEIDWNWLFYELVHLNLTKLSSADVVPGLKRELVNNLIVPLPSLTEQQHIAEVLGVVDSALELADQVIAKTERLKKGLMQQLLTHGIGHTEYKETPIGKIPKDWTITKIEEFAKLQSGGTPRRDVKEYWVDGKIPWLKSGELNDGEISYSEEKINQVGLKNSAAKMFPKGTLLMAMYGKGTVTKTGILGIDATTNQAVCAFILKREDVNPKYVQYYLIFKRNQLLGQLTNPSTDMGRTNIYAGMLGTFQVPMPKMDEQNNIVTILQNVDRKLCLEQLEKSKLLRIKQGMMDLLLSGKVRIRVD